MTHTVDPPDAAVKPLSLSGFVRKLADEGDADARAMLIRYSEHCLDEFPAWFEANRHRLS